MRPGRRRRRKIHRSTAMAGDPLDLFQHAMTNARGVIMFVMLMMALFGQASDAVVQVTANVLETAEKARRLTEERDELRRKVEAMPPVGDPELAARYAAALERLHRDEAALDEVRAASRRRDEELAKVRQAIDEATKARDAALALVPKNAAPRPPSAFVRVSRFQQDKRKEVVLTLSGGRLGRFRVTTETKSISPPATGIAITDQASANEAVRGLLDGFQPGTHRVALLVWEGSFLQAKMVEQAILDLGFDSNPQPARAGTAVTPGAGGVQ